MSQNIRMGVCYACAGLYISDITDQTPPGHNDVNFPQGLCEKPPLICSFVRSLCRKITVNIITTLGNWWGWIYVLYVYNKVRWAHVVQTPMLEIVWW